MAREPSWIDLGTMEYAACWELQKQVAQDVADGRRGDTLLFVQHPAVLTLGANFHESNLLLSREQYAARGIQVERTDRGGDVTFHGPGQLVAYPIFDLGRHGKDLHKWMRDLEETVLRSLESFGIQGRRFPPHTGAWVGDRKIAAIGVKIKRWISLHGIALNCSNSLEPFGLIVPCGIQGYGVTSLSLELGREATVHEAMPVLKESFEKVFSIPLSYRPSPDDST